MGGADKGGFCRVNGIYGGAGAGAGGDGLIRGIDREAVDWVRFPVGLLGIPSQCFNCCHKTEVI